MRQWFGVDIGGTKCAVGTLGPDGRIQQLTRFSTPGPEESIGRFVDVLSPLVEAADEESEPIVGISCGGPLDEDAGLICSPPNLPGWDNVPICDELIDAVGGRAFLMNDANACALAEARYGAGRGARNMIFLTMGTGMGAGLLLNGSLYEGSSRQAGEVGRLPLATDGPWGFGRFGSFEGFCSGGGIARLAALRRPAFETADDREADESSLDAKRLADAAREGDAFALSVWGEVAERLGLGIAVLIDMLNPDRIVIGGIFPRAEDLIVPAMTRALGRHALPRSREACEVVPGELGETVGLFGAVSAAQYRIEREGAAHPEDHGPFR